MPYTPSYSQAPNPVYSRPPRGQNRSRPEPQPEPSIADTAAEQGGIHIEPFYDYQIQPQPVYLVQEQSRPYVIHCTFATYDVTTNPQRIVSNRYSTDRKVIIKNTGTQNVNLTMSDNDTLTMTRFRLYPDTHDDIELHTTDDIYVWGETVDDSHVSVMEEWRDDT